MQTNNLLNAPARLSDLHGDARRNALFARDNARRAAWLREREVRGIWQRIADAVSVRRAGR